MKNIVMNNDQKDAVAKVFAWLKAAMNEIFFILGGYAGVGKTTIAMEIARSLRKAGKTVVFCAPTNKARDVIEEKLKASGVEVNDVATVHGLIYKPNEYGGFEFNPWGLKEVNVLICDECSMLTEQMMEDLKIAAQTSHTRIVLMGDDFQLPAVEKDRNPHKTPFQMVKKESQVTLTKVMRQAGDSKILEYATALRVSGVPAVPAVSAADVEVSNIASMMTQYVSELKAGVDATMIVFRNQTRVQLNRMVREKLYGEAGKGTLLPEETVIGYANTKNLSNGTVTKLPKKFNVLWQGNMTLGTGWMLSHGKGFQEYVLLLQGDDGSRWVVVPNTMQASVQPGWVPADKLPPDWKESDFNGRKTIAADVNIVTFAYAITCHKSQGSQWDSVYVAEANSMGERREQARWLYTAVTRAAKKLVIFDNKHPKATWEHIAGAVAPFLGDAPVKAETVIKEENVPTAPVKIDASKVAAFKSAFFTDAVVIKQEPKQEKAVTPAPASIVREPEPTVKFSLGASARKPVYAVGADKPEKNKKHAEWHIEEKNVSFFESLLGIRK